MKSFADFLKAHKIKDLTTIRKILRGKKIKILNRVSGHQYQDGQNISNVSSSGLYQLGSGHENTYVGWIAAAVPGIGATMYFSEFSVDVSVKKEDFEKELKELEESYLKEKGELTTKLNLMEEYEMEEYDDDVVRINQALDTLESTKSRKAKVKALKELIR